MSGDFGGGPGYFAGPGFLRHSIFADEELREL